MHLIGDGFRIGTKDQHRIDPLEPSQKIGRLIGGERGSIHPTIRLTDHFENSPQRSRNIQVIIQRQLKGVHSFNRNFSSSSSSQCTKAKRPLIQTLQGTASR